MSDIVASARKLVLSTLSLVVGSLVMILVFEQFLAIPSRIPTLVTQVVNVAIVIVSGSIVLFLTRRFKSRLSDSVGQHAAAVFSFFMIVIISLGVVFAILYILQVPPSTLLLGGGIITLVVGLFVSTLLGNIISGALMLVSYPFRVGDNVLLDNIPGRVEEVTAMFTQIRSYAGGETIIPNNAIIQGTVKLTKIPADGSQTSGKFPYSPGDKVYTSYIGEEGVVIDITTLNTRILLDSGKEVTIPNVGVLTGSIHVGRILSHRDNVLNFSLKINWDPERAIKAMKGLAHIDPSTFKSEPEVLYSSLDGQLVELKVICQIDPKKRDRAKSELLRAAYLVRS